MTYDHFWSWWQESCEEALRVARGAHCQLLVAATLLEGHIKRLSCSISCGWSSSHWQLGRHQHPHHRRCMRSQRRCLSVSQQEQIPQWQATPAKRWAPSLNPVRPQRWDIFKEHSTEGVPQCGRSPPQLGLRCPTEASQRKGTLVPCPLLTKIWSTFWESAYPCREQMRGGAPSKIHGLNLPSRATASGLSGVVNTWTCQPGGKSCRQSQTWRTIRSSPRR